MCVCVCVCLLLLLLYVCLCLLCVFVIVCVYVCVCVCMCVSKHVCVCVHVLTSAAITASTLIFPVYVPIIWVVVYYESCHVASTVIQSQLIVWAHYYTSCLWQEKATTLTPSLCSTHLLQVRNAQRAGAIAAVIYGKCMCWLCHCGLVQPIMSYFCFAVNSICWLELSG